MNYPYGYNARFTPGFGAQMPSTGFSGTLGYPSPQMQPQNAPAPVSAPSAGLFSVQPVSSREEALAVIADPLSAGVLLPDLGHGVIYVKKFNPNTGASDFGEFAFVPPKPAPVETPVENPEWVARRDFEAAVEQLRSEIAALKRPSGKAKGGNEE